MDVLLLVVEVIFSLYCVSSFFAILLEIFFKVCSENAFTYICPAPGGLDDAIWDTSGVSHPGIPAKTRDHMLPYWGDAGSNFLTAVQLFFYHFLQ